MTDTDEHLLTAAKLREQTHDSLESYHQLPAHAGLVENSDDLSTMSFLEDTLQSPEDSDLYSLCLNSMMTETANSALKTENGSLLSNLVGVTERDLSADSLQLFSLLNDSLENNQAPSFVTCFGNPNTGKTNSLLLLAELRSTAIPNLEVIANFGAEIVDTRVTSCLDLATALLEQKDVPKFLLLDEASTHFDSRTNRREVATQWTPLAKRFAKIGVDSCGVICHSGKDLHPEHKRLTTLSIEKQSKQTLSLYDRWPADSDTPEDAILEDIEDIPPCRSHYDPDDAAPWSWNLDSDLFARDLDWTELLEELRRSN